MNDSLSTKTKMSHIRADPSSFQFGKGCDGKIGGREDLTTCRQAFDFSISNCASERLVVEGCDLHMVESGLIMAVPFPRNLCMGWTNELTF